MKPNLLRSLLIDLVIVILGCLSLLAPFIFQQARFPGFSQSTFPIMVSLIIVLCLLILFFESQTALLDGKMIALLGVLIAINAGLRFLENAIPGPAGFSPIFFFIILSGYFFSSRVGFLMGALTMLISALITGGIGPWLPGQMITAGWLGQSSALLRPLINKFGWKEKPMEVVLLAGFSAIWGMIYGVVMNLWFWPFLAFTPDLAWSQSLSLLDNIQRYLAYYLATSVLWDVTRSIGNLVIFAVMTKPVIKILSRFQRRFTFKYSPKVDA